jgi:hypothetical protein
MSESEAPTRIPSKEQVNTMEKDTTVRTVPAKEHKAPLQRYSYSCKQFPIQPFRPPSVNVMASSLGSQDRSSQSIILQNHHNVCGVASTRGLGLSTSVSLV